jgi:hypothetical protein
MRGALHLGEHAHGSAGWIHARWCPTPCFNQKVLLENLGDRRELLALPDEATQTGLKHGHDHTFLSMPGQ